MKQLWWKIIAILLIIYSIYYGITGPVPQLGIVHESIRNLYFHVPMWFTMMIMFTIGFVNTILYLNKPKPEYDIRARTFNETGLLFGALGLLTGMLWAKFTWGQFWNNDPKQIGAALCMATYLAYFVLRASIKDEQSRAKISGVYSVFAYALMIPFLYILPEVGGTSSHPGAGDNVNFSNYDSMDNSMRRIFYPAVVGWILMGTWISNTKFQISNLYYKINAQ